MTGLKPKTILLEFPRKLMSRDFENVSSYSTISWEVEKAIYTFLYAKSREILRRDVWPVKILEVTSRRDFSSHNLLRNLGPIAKRYFSMQWIHNICSFTNFVTTNLRIFSTKMNVVIYIRINKQTQNRRFGFTENSFNIRIRYWFGKKTIRSLAW